MLIMLLLLIHHSVFSCLYGVLVLFVLSGLPSLMAENVPQLNGEHFKITAVHETGFLDISTGKRDGTVQFSGYLIDMLSELALPERANFSYQLLPPSGFGSACNPQLSNATSIEPYDARYFAQYNCGTSDINDDRSLRPWDQQPTDMYLGLFYVTPSRQLANQFTIPFLPPTSGTLAMFGTATGIASFEDLAKQQAIGLQKVACGPAGTALLSFVETAYPGLKVKGLSGGEDEIYQSFHTGECEVYIVDGPIAAKFVLLFSERGTCLANGMPIGVIGEPMGFGLSHYSIGIRADIPHHVVSTLSYWLNVLMSCSPLDPLSSCPRGNLATFYEGKGGIGTECGYVQYPPKRNIGSKIGIGLATIPIMTTLGFLIYWMRLRSRQRLESKAQVMANKQAAREREINAFIVKEVQKPLASAKTAIKAVSARTASLPERPEDKRQRYVIKKNIETITASLDSVSSLIEGLSTKVDHVSEDMQKFDQALTMFSSHDSIKHIADGNDP